MIYIAGSFSSPGHREELKEIIAWAKEKYPKHKLFIPMEHFIENGENLPNHIWAKKVFDMDVKAIDKSSMVICLYNGHTSGTGTAWEIGYAYAKRKPIIQWISKSATIASLMVFNSATKHFGNININQK